MIYIPIVLLGFVGTLAGGYYFLSWLLSETSEERQTREERERPPRSFYNPRTWAAFRRLVRTRPQLLMYRRDKKGRFRKLSPGLALPVSRRSRRRTARSPRRTPTRGELRVPAE